MFNWDFGSKLHEGGYNSESELMLALSKALDGIQMMKVNLFGNPASF